MRLKFMVLKLLANLPEPNELVVDCKIITVGLPYLERHLQVRHHL